MFQAIKPCLAASPPRNNTIELGLLSLKRTGHHVQKDRLSVFWKRPKTSGKYQLLLECDTVLTKDSSVPKVPKLAKPPGVSSRPAQQQEDLELLPGAHFSFPQKGRLFKGDQRIS